MVNAQALAGFESRYAPARTFIVAGESKCPTCRAYFRTQILVAAMGAPDGRIRGGPVTAIESAEELCPKCTGASR